MSRPRPSVGSSLGPSLAPSAPRTVPCPAALRVTLLTVLLAITAAWCSAALWGVVPGEVSRNTAHSSRSQATVVAFSANEIEWP